ncbi:WS/DGAT domain-containing protein [Amycolatopsis nalaikhensis]|uniref:diacylglycerol O-acyltransferase n=1 Tax=Amycolatopsis nalaikhensis TaxID=715472 RepID=A0ABY8XF76_9PSEU|nr:WS/DGAT domain-containing protein [Amycolatopsis sp. 2-2]WIV54259.1 WS/DGAT domain-containing protein [Amycolatopsis sp. 2-2]
MTVPSTRKTAGPRRRVPAQDSLWLHLDRPENLMVVTSVLWTRTPVDPARLRSLVADRLLARYPVYLQRAVRRGRGLVWETDRSFDLGEHLVVRDLPAPADQAALEAFVAARRGEPFDPRHPLWTIDLLRDYRGGSALVCRTHHAMADGIRLTQVLFSLLDPADGESAPHAKVGGAAPRREAVAQPVVRLGAAVLEALGDAGAKARRQAARVHPVLETAVSLPVLGATAAAGAAGAAAGFLSSGLDGGPRRVVDAVAGAATTVWHSATGAGELLGPSTATGIWDGEPGVEKTAAWGDPVPLAELARIGHETGTTVNDVCTALVAGALDRYFTAHGTARPGPSDVGWLIPVSLSSFDDELPATLGNHFSLVLARLPLGRRTFAERLAEVHRRVARIRDSYEPVLTFGMQYAIARSPAPVGLALSRFFAGKAVGVLTNVPGPRTPMTLAGAPVEGIVGWAPCSGRQAITICVFSYAGQVRFGFGTDRKLVPDPAALVDALAAEFAAVSA